MVQSLKFVTENVYLHFKENNAYGFSKLISTCNCQSKSTVFKHKARYQVLFKILRIHMVPRCRVIRVNFLLKTIIIQCEGFCRCTFLESSCAYMGTIQTLSMYKKNTTYIIVILFVEIFFTLKKMLEKLIFALKGCLCISGNMKPYQHPKECQPTES